MKQLVIEWQRLLTENEQTCPRCRSTEQEIDSAVTEIGRLLASSGITVHLVKSVVDPESFRKDPLLSNRIVMAGKTLEEWLGAATGQSTCCDVCGGSECRTVEYSGDTHEAVPAALVVRAGLVAAVSLFGIRMPPQANSRIPVLKLNKSSA